MYLEAHCDHMLNRVHLIAPSDLNFPKIFMCAFTTMWKIMK